MRKIPVFAISLLSSFLIFDYFGSNILAYLEANLKNGREYFTYEAIKEIECDVLFVGASQCQGNYNMELVEEELGLDAFNAGMGAQHIDYQTIVANQIINRKTPKLVVWDFDPKLFADDNHVWLKTALTPYYFEAKSINTTLDRVDPYMKWKQRISSYKFNSLPLEYLVYSRGSVDKSQGYMKFPCRNPKEMGIVTEDTYRAKGTDFERKRELMKQTILLWKEKGIKVIVVVSPIHSLIEHEIWGVKEARNLCDELDVSFYDFSQLEGIYTESQFFRDNIHLCFSGASK